MSTTITLLILTLIIIYMYIHFNHRIKSLEKEHEIDTKCRDSLKEYWDKIRKSS